jgi:hypothetical protein
MATMKSINCSLYNFATSKGEHDHHVKVFGEATIFWMFIWLGARVEYDYDATNNLHYISPQGGLSFVNVDIFYSPSILVKKNAGDIYRNGITVRIKYFLFKRNWQYELPQDYYTVPEGQG